MTSGNGLEPDEDIEAEETVSLPALVMEILAELAGTMRTDAAGESIWARGGKPFAALTAGALEVRLPAAVSRAAVRTPDATPSGRGPAWVRFDPPVVDRYAADRATAWIETAWRHATD
jgi:hypothetical protein